MVRGLGCLNLIDFTAFLNEKVSWLLAWLIDDPILLQTELNIASPKASHPQQPYPLMHSLSNSIRRKRRRRRCFLCLLEEYSLIVGRTVLFDFWRNSLNSLIAEGILWLLLFLVMCQATAAAQSQNPQICKIEIIHQQELQWCQMGCEENNNTR